MKSGKQQRLVEAPVYGLRYVGAGAALIDVPARDLTVEELASYDVAVLLASTLYIIAPAPDAAPASDPAPATQE